MNHKEDAINTLQNSYTPVTGGDDKRGQLVFGKRYRPLFGDQSLEMFIQSMLDDHQNKIDVYETAEARAEDRISELEAKIEDMKEEAANKGAERDLES